MPVKPADSPKLSRPKGLLLMFKPSLALACFAFAGFSLSALASEKTAAYSADRDPLAPLVRVRMTGLSRGDLWSLLGEPSTRLTPDVWVYWNYRSTNPSANARGFDTLVVTFKSDRVEAVKLTTEHTIRSLLENRSALRGHSAE